MARIRWLLMWALIVVLASPAAAPEPYPSRPVRFIAPFSAGVPADVLGRLHAQKLGERSARVIKAANIRAE